MKKKILLSLTAIAIVFTSLFSFTACNKNKVKITKNMKPEKLYEMLVNADIKSYTVEISSEGYSITLQYTPDGYLSAEKEGDGPAEEKIFTKDASRVYMIEKDGEGNITFNAFDMMGAKYDLDFDEDDAKENFFYYAISPLASYIYDVKNGYDALKLTVEKDKIIFVDDEEEMKVVVSNVNKTTLNIPEEYKDYASRETTAYIANFSPHGDGLAFTGFKQSVIEFSIPETFQGKKVEAIVANYNRSLKKITIPKSVNYIDGLDFLTANNENIYFAGTKAQWGEIKIASRYIRDKAIVVHCTDGDVEVKEY